MDKYLLCMISVASIALTSLFFLIATCLTGEKKEIE